MTDFIPGKPVSTEEPVIKVRGGLKPGKYVFRLVVVDDKGIESAPDEVSVVVLERSRIGPIPVVPGIPLPPLNPLNRPINRGGLPR